MLLRATPSQTRDSSLPKLYKYGGPQQSIWFASKGALSRDYISTFGQIHAPVFRLNVSSYLII
jgi:hypothetical protein